jgi:hypothetical protein
MPPRLSEGPGTGSQRVLRSCFSDRAKIVEAGTSSASAINVQRRRLREGRIECEFCFAPIRGVHWSAASRAYHWKAVRAAAGWSGSLYLATRHFAG